MNTSNKQSNQQDPANAGRKDKDRGRPNATDEQVSEEQRKNQEQMGVRPDHKTEDMEKGKRGTFP